MAEQTTILLTAFEPFGGRTRNASAEALQQFMKREALGMNASFHTAFLPVEAGLASDTATTALDSLQPDYLICMGEAPCDAICLECIGFNERRYPIPDNAGNMIREQPIVSDGPDHYRSTLPVEKMLMAAEAQDMAVILSDDAGRYLCNELLYSVLRHAALTRMNTLIGFIHVPYLPEEVKEGARPSMKTEDAVRALSTMIDALLND